MDVYDTNKRKYLQPGRGTKKARVMEHVENRRVSLERSSVQSKYDTLVVADSDALTRPGAVVVQLDNACVTERAVVGTSRTIPENGARKIVHTSNTKVNGSTLCSQPARAASETSASEALTRRSIGIRGR